MFQNQEMSICPPGNKPLKLHSQAGSVLPDRPPHHLCEPSVAITAWLAMSVGIPPIRTKGIRLCMHFLAFTVLPHRGAL